MLKPAVGRRCTGLVSLGQGWSETLTFSTRLPCWLCATTSGEHLCSGLSKPLSKHGGLACPNGVFASGRSMLC